MSSPFLKLSQEIYHIDYQIILKLCLVDLSIYTVTERWWIVWIYYWPPKKKINYWRNVMGLSAGIINRRVFFLWLIEKAQSNLILYCITVYMSSQNLMFINNWSLFIKLDKLKGIRSYKNICYICNPNGWSIECECRMGYEIKFWSLSTI